MKNTSLFVTFWAMPKSKPSADPTECKRARFRALGGSQVIGLKALIASYHLSWSNTQARRNGEAGKDGYLFILSVFLTADASDICDPLVLYTKTDTKPIYLIFHVKQKLKMYICKLKYFNIMSVRKQK